MAIAENKRAYHDYHIIQEYEAGLEQENLALKDEVNTLRKELSRHENDRQGARKAMASNSDYLTLDQLCSLLQVPRTWVYRQTRERAIPFIKLGKYLRFNRSQVLKWVEEQRVNR